MSRKRLWEIGATMLLLLAVAGIIGGFFTWRERQRERQRRLDAELRAYLVNSHQEQAPNPVRLRSLLRQGASLSVEGEEGWTVLIDAVAAHDVPLLRQLLARGMDPNAGLLDGYTALMVAVKYERVEAAQVLLEHGAAVNQQTVGLTPLGWAKFLGDRPRMIRLLKQHGAKE
jgi:ankyrin repeat protein